MKWVLVLLLVPVLIAAGFYAHDLAMGLHAPYRAAGPHPRYPELGVPWPMHPVDNPGDWLPNGLDVADVNGDGYPDLLVNYEFRGRVRVVFHPGGALSRDRPWPAVDVGVFPNAERAALGDLDGDGLVDVAVVHGVEHTGREPGVRVLWGLTPPDPGLPTSAFRWADAGDVPESQGGWHFHELQAVDIDADGDLDLVVGGRRAWRGDPRTPGPWRISCGRVSGGPRTPGSRGATPATSGLGAATQSTPP